MVFCTWSCSAEELFSPSLIFNLLEKIFPFLVPLLNVQEHITCSFLKVLQAMTKAGTIRERCFDKVLSKKKKKNLLAWESAFVCSLGPSALWKGFWTNHSLGF